MTADGHRAVCVCACLTAVSWTAHPSAHPLACPERRASEDTSHAFASSQQPQHNAGLRAQRLAKPTRSHAQHHPATTTTTTTTTAKLQRRHPRKHHPSRNNANATITTRLRATRQNTSQKHANEARDLKHDNARPASKRMSAAETTQHTQARRPRARRRPPRADPTTANPSRENSH
jgi:hypothetical protein